MSTIIDIRGVPVEFPFKPYDIQKDYMGKVIECLQNESVGVLESPTGTGKTLSLLCSSLAWLQLKKVQLQAERKFQVPEEGNEYLVKLRTELEEKAGQVASSRVFLGIPTIIYASRTHSQLSQAMQELKRTAYKHMNASVLGSRDLLCIHPDITSQPDRKLGVQMCQLKLSTRSCHFNNRVEQKKDDPAICNLPVIDIEDMVKLGTKHTFCPYYMTKELQQRADIIFTPYNYLLDILSRKALGVNLKNTVIILDEGHNVEKICEESASIELKSTDIALAIDELTAIMKIVQETPQLFEDAPKDLDPDHLATFKEMLLNFEKVLDDVPMTAGGDEITSFPGDYIFEMLEKAQITGENCFGITELIDRTVQFLMAHNEGPLGRKGKGLQLFAEFLIVVFASKSSKEKVKWCYKVHMKEEDAKGKLGNWLSKATGSSKSRVLNFWCFSPGFGMEKIMCQGIRALILTSGTLAPLKPLISELGLDVKVQLENPHIVTEKQICVKIVPKGPDGEPLNSSYQNRDNPKYVSSLGRAIVNLTRIIPSGLLIFFPSYPIMQKCQNAWQQEGIWSNIATQKAIFVEPKFKQEFSMAMEGYYAKIRDPNLKGAIFMGVCRGKVSEGLDFADANGRAVIITGLPYPPLKDPRVVLKRRYLDQCHVQNREYLTGQEWYSLEASRAVNQAIGRVIRHQHDYGAILLLDQRFDSFRIRSQVSKWLRDHIKVVHKYGEMIRDLSGFFKRAQSEFPLSQLQPLPTFQPPEATFTDCQRRRKGDFDFSTNSQHPPQFSSQSALVASDATVGGAIVKDEPTAETSGLIAINPSKRESLEPLVNNSKRKKIALYQKTDPFEGKEENDDVKTTMSQYVAMAKSRLGSSFTQFAAHLKTYSISNDIDEFIQNVDPLIPRHLRFLLVGIDPYIKSSHRNVYRNYLRRNNLPVPEDL